MSNFVELAVNNKWFELHPEKIAGKEYKTTSFMFPYRIKGTKDDVMRVTKINKANNNKKLAIAKAKALKLKLKLL